MSEDFWMNSPQPLDSPGFFNESGGEGDFDFAAMNFDSPLVIPTTPIDQPEANGGNFFDADFFTTAHIPQTAQPMGGHRRTPSLPVHLTGIIDEPPIAVPTKQPIEQPIQKPTLPIVSHTRRRSQPPVIILDDSFSQVCSDKSIKFNPKHLGFIPGKAWADHNITFGDLVQDFFQRKNNANSRFSHKLYNALKISEADPFYSVFLGVEWITPKVLKVNKKVFARLLGIKTVDGSLFHQQGNFPSHGFVELSPTTAPQYLSEDQLQGVDYDEIRLLIHQPGVFVRGCTESVLEACKWVSSKKKV